MSEKTLKKSKNLLKKGQNDEKSWQIIFKILKSTNC